MGWRKFVFSQFLIFSFSRSIPNPWTDRYLLNWILAKIHRDYVNDEARRRRKQQHHRVRGRTHPEQGRHHRPPHASAAAVFVEQRWKWEGWSGGSGGGDDSASAVAQTPGPGSSRSMERGPPSEEPPSEYGYSVPDGANHENLEATSNNNDNRREQQYPSPLPPQLDGDDNDDGESLRSKRFFVLRNAIKWLENLRKTQKKYVL